MKKKIINKTNMNGSYMKIETIETTKEDGFVEKKEIRPTDMNSRRKYHKGSSKTYTLSTNDPRITRPFVYIMSALFFMIGIVCIMLSDWFFGIIFAVAGIIIFIDSKKDIDKIENELKEKGTYSKEFTEEEKQEYKNIAKDAINGIKTSVFNKSNYNWFLKTTLPLYFIVCLIAFIICLLIDTSFAIFMLILFIVVGFLYYFILSLICK